MKQHLEWIESSRTIAMTIVVLAHINDIFYFRSGCKEWWSIGISVLVCFTVPMFFMISGYLLGRRNQPAQNTRITSEFFRRKVDTVVIPFFVWNIIYMFLFKSLYNWPILSAKTLWHLTTGYIHLYFVFILLQFLILYHFIKPRLNGNSLKPLLFGSMSLTLIFYMTSDILLWNQGADNHFFEWHYGKAFIPWSLFFVWGIWISHSPRTFEVMCNKSMLLGVITVASLAAFYWETSLEVNKYGYNARQYFLITGALYQFLGANFILVLSYRLHRIYNHSFLLDMLNRSGKDTFGIYLSHLAIILVLSKVLEIFNLSFIAIIEIPVLFVVSWTLSHLLVLIFRRTQSLLLNKMLFGGRM